MSSAAVDNQIRVFRTTFKFSHEMPESLLCGDVIRKDEIYGMDLQGLLDLLTVLSSVSGGAGLLHEALYHDKEGGRSGISAADRLILENLNASVSVVHEVILEKFTRRP